MKLGELLPNSGQELIKTLQQKSVKTPVDKSSFIEVRGSFHLVPSGLPLVLRAKHFRPLRRAVRSALASWDPQVRQPALLQARYQRNSGG
jgi:hypothetical protein